MTLRSSDLQSDSDLDCIRNSCDVLRLPNFTPVYTNIWINEDWSGLFISLSYQSATRWLWGDEHFDVSHCGENYKSWGPNNDQINEKVFCHCLLCVEYHLATSKISVKGICWNTLLCYISPFSVINEIDDKRCLQKNSAVFLMR